MKVSRLFLGILAASLTPLAAQSQIRVENSEIVVLSVSELKKLTAAAKAADSTPDVFNESLLQKLVKQGRVLNVDSTKSYNCDGHACTVKQ